MELETHPVRIRLSTWMIREVQSEALGWISDVALQRGEHAMARRHIVCGLWQ